MHDTSAAIEARVQRVYRERIVPARYRLTAPVPVEAWEAPGEPVAFGEVAWGSARSFPAGEAWGRPWGSTWLRLEGTVPADWPADARVELVVDLGYAGSAPGFQAEGLVFTADGQVVKGIQPRNTWVRLTERPGERFCRYVEAASNPDVGGGWQFRPTPLGDLATAGTGPLYTFGGAHVAVLDVEAFALERDVWTLTGVLEQLPYQAPRRAQILRALERAVDVLDPDDVAGTAADARAQLRDALAARASASSHRVVAVGHAHIDSAWLWPVRETVRKCARTFANVLDLMDEHRGLVFAASSAQQYEWMRDHYPQLFERIRSRAREGRFVPVGGMWVESDTNLPGGEAMVRQFVYGKGFFLRELGVEPEEVWLPDSFGYSAALPQIAAAAGCRNLLTQKLSWNDTNAMPHHSFLWEGIDGTRVFTHFPPVATYNSDLSGADLSRAERAHAERGLSDLSLVPFGYGDGGGGPTREMLETAYRKADLDGSPRVQLGAPDVFFRQARAELPDPPVWSGELYLEFHRGTYTSQSRMKRGNRRCEHLLREAELWSATAAVRVGVEYPAEQLRRAWKVVLLQQFHDILPGTSISWVHREAERQYDAVAASLERLIEGAFDALADGAGPPTPVAFNASPFAGCGVPALGAGPATTGEWAPVRDGDTWLLESDAVSARLDADGRLVSLVDRRSGRDAIPPGDPGNVLQLFRDTPNRWDAWDIDAAYQRMPLGGGTTTSVRAAGSSLEVARELGRSTVTQLLRLSPNGAALEIETQVDWHEQQKLLKLAFPFDVHADQAASEVQFGHVRRPTHANTSWDAARFETPAQRWVRVAEPDFGVTVANDGVYGHDISRTTRAAGGTTTRVRASLLRAPLFPDPQADQGRHVFRHSIVIGGALAGVAEGYRLNLPLRTAAAAPVQPLVAVDDPAVVVEAVKLAEDGSGDVVVRLYEARGARASAVLTPHFPVAAAERTDLLERPLPEQPADPTRLDLRAFELVTVRLRR